MGKTIGNHDMIIAEDALIADVQFAIHNLLEAKGKSRADLARALNVSEARVSQLFRDNTKNLTLRTIARIFCVLGEHAQITSSTLKEIIPIYGRDDSQPAKPMCGVADFVLARLHEECRARAAFRLEANDNAFEDDLIAA
jgi:transcriptional regulator with XRE-family HTH domain